MYGPSRPGPLVRRLGDRLLHFEEEGLLVRGIALFAVLTAALSTAALAAPAHHVKAAAHHQKVRDDVAPPAGHGKVAPADEYFGRLKMSVLGIRNELNHLQSQVEASPENSESVMGTASLVEDAIKDWERHYPSDPWLAKNVYQLTHVYANVRSDVGHSHAMSTLQWLTARYDKNGKAGLSAKARQEVNGFGAPAGQASAKTQP